MILMDFVSILPTLEEKIEVFICLRTDRNVFGAIEGV
jgi:hypothetical protein